MAASRYQGTAFARMNAVPACLVVSSELTSGCGLTRTLRYASASLGRGERLAEDHATGDCLQILPTNLFPQSLRGGAGPPGDQRVEQ